MLTAVLFTIAFSQSVSASSINHSDQMVDYENLVIQEIDGSILSFDNLRDMEIYVNPLKQIDNSGESIIRPNAYPETVVGTDYKYYQFMGYSMYTKDWQKK